MSNKQHPKKTVPVCPTCAVEVQKSGGGYICPVCGERYAKDEVDHVDPKYVKELR